MTVPLDAGWEVAPSDPSAAAAPSDGWIGAQVPGTAAAALHAAGRWRPGDTLDFDASDWWFRTRLAVAPAAPGEELWLCLDGIATVAEVWVNGTLVVESTSMFEAHAVEVGGLLTGDDELVIRCRALAPLLGVRRRPRARWRTRVADNALRWFRTSLLGRAPGFAPGPAPVGPYRPVLVKRCGGVVASDVRLRPRVEADGTGALAVALRLRAVADAALPAPVTATLSGPSGAATVELAPGSDGVYAGELRVPDVARWWPHTHGEPVLHDVVVDAGSARVAARRVGFRTLAAPSPDGLDLHVNGVAVFARGAVWTPADPVSLAPDDATLRRALEQLRDAGMNLVRVPGLGAYEEPRFYELCDELGLLVWQDFMFANMDYPVADEGFRATVAAEVDAVLTALGGRPSLAVLCGNSEVEQQVAMLGLDPELGRGELFGALLPERIAAADVDAIWIPSAPSGGVLPFQPSAGVANYFGVGGYRRPLNDVRLAGVQFASECLAFANVPSEEAVAAVLPDSPGSVAVHHPRWKAGVPRDNGSGWDFEDVRDHYLHELFGVDPVALRSVDHERYLELSRAVSGEVMAEVFGEWRRAASPCAGGIVLWLRDLVPGAGWGLVDHAGEPKVALHHLRRALAPVAVWTTDEGMNGVAIHAANDTSGPVRAVLGVRLLRDGEQVVAEASEALELAPHATIERSVEGMIGRFVDASYAYRFGPPGHDAIAVTLHAGAALLSHAVRFPAGRPLAAEPAERLGLQAVADSFGEGAVALRVTSRRLAYGVRIHAPGWELSDDALTVVPGVEHVVQVRPRAPGTAWPGAALTALNLQGRVQSA